MQEVNVSTELQSVIQTSNCNILPENGNSRGTAIVWKNTLECSRKIPKMHPRLIKDSKPHNRTQCFRNHWSVHWMKLFFSLWMLKMWKQT